jgi:hypothetical protein
MHAARASGAAISKTTIKKITLALNRRTQRGERAILFSSALLDPRTCAGKHTLQRKNRAPRGERGFNAIPRLLKTRIAR